MDVFVFGSNLAGRHGKGSAKEALTNHGALYGKGIGFHGQSYAIPTKGHKLEILPLSEIHMHVEQFLHFADIHPEMTFNVVEIGCGLAGYKPDDIAHMFVDCPNNVKLPASFYEIIIGF